MKRCPRCNRIYSENDLNFCLDDGELLTRYTDEEPTRSLRDNPPPTVVLDSPRVTNPIDFSTGQPMQPWQGQGSYTPQPQYSPFMLPRSPNQTLAVVSLCLGIGAVTVGWCCYTGLALAPAALITGFIALTQIKNHPNDHSGKGMAIAGLITGGAYFVIMTVVFVIYIIAVIAGGVQ
jgi:hypothetical protein